MLEKLSAAQLLLSLWLISCAFSSQKPWSCFFLRRKMNSGLEQENPPVKTGGAQAAHTSTLIFSGILLACSALSPTTPELYLLSKHIQTVSNPLQKIYRRIPQLCKLSFIILKSVAFLGALLNHHQYLKVQRTDFSLSRDAHTSPR